MEKEEIFRDDKMHVVKVFLYGEWLYTTTYIYDEFGMVDKTVTVFASGAAVVQ